MDDGSELGYRSGGFGGGYGNSIKRIQNGFDGFTSSGRVELSTVYVMLS